jgi:hypothetical protein
MTDLMAGLGAAARLHKPRLFTLYGPFHDSEELTVLGWGMDFRTLSRTLYYDPDSGKTHSSDNPDRLLRLYGRIADVRLEWLDSE